MVLLTDEKFDYAPRPPVSPETRQTISAKLLKKELPFQSPDAPDGSAPFCARCRRPVLPGEDRNYCRPCEATVARCAREAALSSGPLSLGKALGIGAAVGLVIIWAALHLSK